MKTDRQYAIARFRETFGYDLDLKTPKTFNEKIQWIKLYDRNSKYKLLSDKFLVRKYVSQKIGDVYLNQLIAVYSSPEDIDFNELPNQFVLRMAHGSGWNIICHDKNQLDIEECRKKLFHWSKQDYYHLGREWVYKKIKPRILCEKFLSGDPKLGLLDYKIFCFHGNPKYIQVDIDRYTNHSRDFYDVNWKKQYFSIMYPLYKHDIPRPKHLDKMLEISKILADKIPFCRVDLYSFQETVLFGEITFYPGCGFEKFYPSIMDEKLGGYINVP